MRAVRRLGVAAIGLAALGLFTAGAAAAATRYASPDGSAQGSCRKAHPCPIRHAVTGASAGDRVLLKGGVYELGSNALDVPAAITLAPAGRANALLHSQGDHTVETFGAGTTIRDLAIVAENPGSVSFGIDTQAKTTIERCFVLSSGVNRAAILAGSHSVVRDTIAIASDGADAILTSTGGATLSNVTAFATGGSARGLSSDNGFGSPQKVIVKDSILTGAGSDIDATDQQMGDQPDIVVKVSHSNFDAVTDQAPDARIVQGSGNQTDPPIYVDSLNFDFRQAPGSPTINAGAGTANHRTDFEGNPRIQGSAIDMGADEATQPPESLLKLRKHVLKPGLKLKVPLVCPPADCQIDASGALRLPGSDVMLPIVSRSARQGKRVHIVFSISQSNLHRIKQAGENARLTFSAHAEDGAGFTTDKARSYHFSE
jgi:hypothetical protein